MTLRGLLVRFTLIYIGLLIVIGVGFHLLGAKSGTSGNAGALIGAVMGSCLWFARANKRFFSPIEKRNVILSMIAIDLVFQTFVASALLLGVPGGIGSAAMLFGILFVGSLHALVIWFFVGWSGKQFAKEAAAKRP